MAFPDYYDEDDKAFVHESLQELIDIFGVEVILIYPPLLVNCPACAADPVGNKPSGHWRTGSPALSSNMSICGMCGGDGKIAHEQKESIQLILIWNPSRYMKLPGNIRVPEGTLMTRGTVDQVPKILRATEAIIGGSHYRGKLSGEPNDYSNFDPDKYSIAFWERIG